MCVAWGQEHYRTFDNKVYTFSGACTYTLARDCSLNTFTVNVVNDRNCHQGAACKRELDLYLGDSKVRREGGRRSFLSYYTCTYLCICHVVVLRVTL